MEITTALKPIHRILVGQRPDGHETVATELALAVARPLRAKVKVVQVEKRHPLLDRLGVAYARRLERRHFDVRRTPRELADAAGFPAERLEVETHVGRARNVLLEEAENWSADLVIIGRSGVETLSRITLGTVTDALVRNLACPLLVAHGSLFPPKRTLFPVDLSRSSEQAMACGLDFLNQTKTNGAATSEALLVVPEEINHQVDATASRELGQFLAQLTGTRGEIAAAVGRGNVVLTILETARERSVDLIVLGTHGQGSGPIQRQMVGSVVAPVLFDPPCHVLLVPPATQFGAEVADAVVSQTAPHFEGV